MQRLYGMTLHKMARGAGPMDMNHLLDNIKTRFEQQAFGVCDWWGEKLGIRSSDIRLFFIYASFLTIGSPVILYMIMAFVLNLRRLMHRQRGNILDM